MNITDRLKSAAKDFPVINENPEKLLLDAAIIIENIQRAVSVLGEKISVGDLGYRTEEGKALRSVFIAVNQSLGLDQ